MDYTELIKHLRYCSDSAYTPCNQCNLWGKPSCESLKNDAADAIEKLLARTETVMGYDVNDLILFATACRNSGVGERDLKAFAQNVEFAFQIMQAELNKSIQEALSRMCLDTPNK